jgi:hypothetical protein
MYLYKASASTGVEEGAVAKVELLENVSALTSYFQRLSGSEVRS